MADLASVPALVATATEAVSSPYWVVISAAVLPIASGAWVFYQHWTTRKDKRSEGLLTREQTLMRDIDAQRAASDAAAKIVFDRVQAELVRRDLENTRKDARIDALETDRDRGWYLARWWYRKAYDMSHLAANAFTVADILTERAGLPRETRPSLELPSLESPP